MYYGILAAYHRLLIVTTTIVGKAEGSRSAYFSFKFLHQIEKIEMYAASLRFLNSKSRSRSKARCCNTSTCCIVVYSNM